MSVSISNGWRAKGSAAGVFQLSERMRPILDAASRKAFADAVMQEVVKRLDMEALGSFKPASRTTWHSVVEYGLSQVSGVESVTFDTSYSVKLMHRGGYAYAVFRSYAVELTRLWELESGMSWYSYWDHSDRPDDISEAAWRMRGREWDAVLKSGWLVLGGGKPGYVWPGDSSGVDMGAPRRLAIFLHWLDNELGDAGDMPKREILQAVAKKRAEWHNWEGRDQYINDMSANLPSYTIDFIKSL